MIILKKVRSTHPPYFNIKMSVLYSEITYQLNLFHLDYVLKNLKLLRKE
jgi:hypothetical protein